MARPRVQILLDDLDLDSEFRRSLDQFDAQLDVQPFTHDSNQATALHQGRLVLTRDGRTLTNGKLARLIEWFDRDPCATLVACEMPPSDEAILVDELAGRAIRFICGESAGTILAQLSAMCSMHRTFEALRQELLELRRHDEQVLASLRQLQDELRLAGRIQRDLLLSPIPSVRGAALRVMHRAAADVSGDVYHVARLDATRTVIVLADATGHGFAAGLLSVFVARCVTSALHDLAARPEMTAGELVKRLNENLLDARLCEGHFVTALAAVYDEDSRELQWARAGSPYPLFVEQANPPRFLQSDGMLLGVDRSANFETCNVRLSPGDLVAFHTDGVEAGAHSPWLPEDPEQSMDEIVSSPDHPKDDVTAIFLRVH